MAKVVINHAVKSEIKKGVLILLGIENEDSEENDANDNEVNAEEN